MTNQDRVGRSVSMFSTFKLGDTMNFSQHHYRCTVFSPHDPGLKRNANPPCLTNMPYRPCLSAEPGITRYLKNSPKQHKTISAVQKYSTKISNITPKNSLAASQTPTSSKQPKRSAPCVTVLASRSSPCYHLLSMEASLTEKNMPNASSNCIFGSSSQRSFAPIRSRSRRTSRPKASLAITK